MIKCVVFLFLLIVSTYKNINKAVLDKAYQCTLKYKQITVVLFELFPEG